MRVETSYLMKISSLPAIKEKNISNLVLTEKILEYPTIILFGLIFYIETF